MTRPLTKDQLLPAFLPPKVVGLVIAETEMYDEGDGVKATITPFALVIEIRAEGSEGTMSIPITTLLTAIQDQNKVMGS